MAEHSICHPGRPGPQGLSQDGSSGLAAFHSTKSATASRSYSSSCSRPNSRAWAASSGRTPESRPYCGKEEMSKYTDPSLA